MNDSPRPPRPTAWGKHVWLFPAILAGIIVGAICGMLVPEIMKSTALVGRIFIGAVLVVALPLVVSQFSLALNNPRERVRRGVNQAKILVRALVAAAILIVVSLILAAILPQSDPTNSIMTLLGRLNPEQFFALTPGGGILIALVLAIIVAALLDMLGEKAQNYITFFNRVSRASIRSFRLLLLVAPLGLLSVVGAHFAGSAQEGISLVALSVIAAAGGLMLYATAALGVDWMVGQLRPPRKDARSFDRDRRGPRRAGAQPISASRGPMRDRPSYQRPGSDRPRERSPFDTGVSSTPVLDVAGGTPPPATRPAPTAQTESSERRPDDNRPARPPRDGQRDQQRSGYRDRGPRGPRDGFRDRGPRGQRDDRRGGSSQGNRGGFRPDQRDAGQTPERETPVEERTAKPVETPNTAAVSADLARISEQLNRSPRPQPVVSEQPEPRVSERKDFEPSVQPEARPPQPMAVREQQPVEVESRRHDEPVASEETGHSDEMRYGRTRHRKYERSDSEPAPMLPGIEPPEPIDKFSTEDISFGRTKRRKGPR